MNASVVRSRPLSPLPVPLARPGALDPIRSFKDGKPMESVWGEGVWGEPPADLETPTDPMVKLWRFAADAADRIEEIDLNPVLVHAAGEGVSVVDALIVGRSEAGGGEREAGA